jgi:hypothetical protein
MAPPPAPGSIPQRAVGGKRGEGLKQCLSTSQLDLRMTDGQDDRGTGRRPWRPSSDIPAEPDALAAFARLGDLK